MLTQPIHWLVLATLAGYPGADGPPGVVDDPVEFVSQRARKRFADLRPSELHMFECVVRGETYRPGNGDPHIRAERLAWICTSPQVVPLVPYRGVRLENVEIEGELDLGGAKVPFPISIKYSQLPAKITLVNCEIRALSLEGSTIGELDGRSMRVDFEVRLGDGLKARRQVNLSHAKIGSDLNLSGGCFESVDPKEDNAIYADRVHVGRDLLMGYSVDSRMWFEAKKTVGISGSTIDGSVNCDGGHFSSPTAHAIDAAGMRVGGNVHFARNERPFSSAGLIELSNAQIGGNLYFNQSRMIRRNGELALRAHRLGVDGDVEFVGGEKSGEEFRAEGTVDLIGAQIGGSLICRRARFYRPDTESSGNQTALDLSLVNVGKDVRLSGGTKTDGVVILERSSIGSNLEGIEGEFRNVGGVSINAVGMSVKGSVRLMEPCKVLGTVDLAGARIGADLEFSGGTFGETARKGDTVIDANGAQIEGDVRFKENVKTEGGVRFQKDIDLFGKVILHDAKVGRFLIIKNISGPSREVVEFQLIAARAGVLDHPRTGWPAKGRLYLDNFVYDIVDPGLMDTNDWIEWLGLQASFSGGPHEQLASVLTKIGRPEAATEILVDKEVAKGNHPEPSSWRLGRWAWYKVLGPCIDFGYAPAKSLLVGVVIVLVGWFVFAIAARNRLFEPKEKDPGASGRTFKPLLYSIDLFTPVITFYERDFWALNLQPGPHRYRALLFILRSYWIFHIIMGWVITSFIVAGILGLVRHG
jgi:hypothetical protein